MKSFHILFTSACLLSLSLSHADPIESEPSPSFYTSEMEEELTLLDDQIDEFEEEILALEEELKKDSEDFEEAIGDSSDDFAGPGDIADDSFSEGLEEAVTFEEPVGGASEDFAGPGDIADDSFSEGVDELEEAVVQVEPEASQESLMEEPIIAQDIDPVSEADGHLEFHAVTSEELSPIEPVAPKSVEISELDRAALSGEAPATIQVDVQAQDPQAIEVNLEQAFAGSPYIYTLLGAMSVTAIGIWLYSVLSLKSYASPSKVFLKNLQNKLASNQFDDALSLCSLNENVFSKMIASGIHSRRHGLPMMIEVMKAEGKRASVSFWQRLGLLNDIAILAPMLGLLGTVLGMFYAFYDINRSIESISTLFDGLGVSVGTTVAGLSVAILALILHSTAKYRLVRTLAYVENEAQSLATLIDDRTTVSKA